MAGAATKGAAVKAELNAAADPRLAAVPAPAAPATAGAAKIHIMLSS